MDKINDYLFGLKFYVKRKLEGQYKGILESDDRIHNIITPIATHSPRILSSAATSTINTIQCDRYEEYETGNEVKLINAASYHYGGYGTLEYGSIDVLKNIVDRFDLICDNEQDTILDETVRSEFARYMGYTHCTFTSTGYGMNMYVFQSLKNMYMDIIFIMDEECHNSMFMGVRSTASKYYKFKHNDLDDLIRLLGELNTNNSNTNRNIVVCVESLYSMSGSICPLNDIVELKHKYGFKLYIDEAHSLFTLGKTGRGILEYCNINPIDVDILGFTLSKSMGGIGGAIVSHCNLDNNVRMTKYPPSHYSVPIVIKARLLQVIRKTQLMHNRMLRLRFISDYVYDKLNDIGLIIKNVRGSPIISFHVGTFRNLSLVVNNAQREGLAITGAGPPATKNGEAVVRICLCANHTDEHICFIIDKIEELCRRYKIKGYNGKKIIHNIHISSNKDVNASKDLDPDTVLRLESDKIDNEIIQLIGHDFPINNVLGTCLDKYGLGACSARWLYGTFDIHLKAEKIIGNRYGMKCMIYSDSDSTELFTLEALIEPLKNKKIKHNVLIPYEMNTCINMSKIDNNRIVTIYEPHNIPIMNVKHYTTIYVANHEYIEDIMKQLSASKKCKGITLIIKDTTYGDNLDIKRDIIGNNVNIDRVVIIGTFDNINLQGGYCVSDNNTIEILRWRSRGYFFTASPMPITMQRLCDQLQSL